MQGGRRGPNSFFDFDPFAGFSGFGGLGGHRSLLSSVLEGRDPFDDPFFTRPFGAPFGSMFESGFFGSSASPFTGAPSAGFIEHKEPQPNKRRGPIIEELNSDDENAEDGGANKMKDNPRKHSRLDKEPYVGVPDGEIDGRMNKHIHHSNEYSNRMTNMHPQPQSQSQCFTFQSSSVSYGGQNGAYYTKSMTRRTGSDGVTFEERKEADSTTRQANHRISRGIHNKGHTLTRKLNSDGRVDTMQTLHNLNEDELNGFEQAWEGSSGRHFAGSHRLEGGYTTGHTSHGQASRGNLALPSTQLPDHPVSIHNNPNMASRNNALHNNMQHAGRKSANRGPGGRAEA